MNKAVDFSVSFLILEIYLIVWTIWLGSLLLPLSGSGERYGESVSTKILLVGMDLKVSTSSLFFLKVIIPLAEN